MKKTLVFSFFIILFIGCVSTPDEVVSTDQSQSETDNSEMEEQIELDQGQAEQLEIVELELIEPQAPIEIEVVNLRPSQDMDYPPFNEIDLSPAMVNNQGWFLQEMEGRLNTPKVSSSHQYYRFLSDGSCEMVEQQSYYDADVLRFRDGQTYKGVYRYQPFSYLLEVHWQETTPENSEPQELQESWQDSLIINEAGIFNIYFNQDETQWSKTRKYFRGQGDSREVEYVQLELAVGEEFFTFSMSQFSSTLQGDPDYQSLREFEIKGRGEDMIGKVFFLEDPLTYHNEYFYLYQTPRGVVPLERWEE